MGKWSMLYDGAQFVAEVIPMTQEMDVPGVSGAVSQFAGYGLWLLAFAGLGALGCGIYKFATADGSGRGYRNESFRWISGGVVAILLSGSLIIGFNGI